MTATDGAWADVASGIRLGVPGRLRSIDVRPQLEAAAHRLIPVAHSCDHLDI